MNNTLQVMQNLTSSKNKINSGDLSSSLDILEKIVNGANSTQSIIEKKVIYHFCLVITFPDKLHAIFFLVAKTIRNKK